MRPHTIGKLVLAVGGIAVFSIGIRFANPSLRWTGIGLVAAAWLLRFAKDP